MSPNITKLCKMDRVPSTRETKIYHGFLSESLFNQGKGYSEWQPCQKDLPIESPSSPRHRWPWSRHQPARSPPSLSSAWLVGHYSCKWCSSDQSLRLQLTASPIFTDQKDIENNHSGRHEWCWLASKKFLHFSWGIRCCLWYFQKTLLQDLQLLRLSEISIIYEVSSSPVSRMDETWDATPKG